MIPQDERRMYPRVNTDITAEVEFGQETLAAQVVNISVGGFLIEGGSQLTNISASPDTGTIEMQIRFDLDSHTVETRCRVVYKRRLSYEKAALGVKIISIDDGSRNQIAAFVSDNLI